MLVIVCAQLFPSINDPSELVEKQHELKIWRSEESNKTLWLVKTPIKPEQTRLAQKKVKETFKTENKITYMKLYFLSPRQH